MKDLKWNPEKATLLLPVPKPDINPAVVSYAAENGFVEKSEFHLSIISFVNGKKIMDKHAGNTELLEQVRTLADEFAWNYEPLPGYFVIEKYYDEAELEKSGYKDVPNHMRKTIVQRETLADLAHFYTKLSELTGIAFDVPFSHLTLFAWADYEPMMTQGIGLYSEADFEKYLKEKLSI